MKPYLQLSTNFDSITRQGYYTFKVVLKNVGLGPAIIKEKAIKLENKEINDIHEEYEEWVKLVNRFTPANGNAECRSSQCDSGHAIDKSESIDLLLVNFPEQDMSFMDARDVAIELSKQIKITIKYKSHFGENYQCTKKNN